MTATKSLVINLEEVNVELEKETAIDKPITGRYYLPVLGINRPDDWPSQPLEKRRHLTDEVAYKTCLGNCCGVNGLKGACCHMDPDDLEHVLGPVTDKDVHKIVKWLKTKGFPNTTRQDVVIDFEEGKIIGEKFFNNHPIFASKSSYPIMRFQILGPRFGCKFLNPTTKLCGIYKVRPVMCQTYYCEFIKANFLITTKDKPNTYQKIR